MPGIGLKENENELMEVKAMNESLMLILSLASGILFGIFYFGGLWLTLKHMPDSKQPALLTVSSFLGRSAVCLFGFYLISGNGLWAMGFCLAGFMLSKVVLIRRLNPHTRVVGNYG
jgi:F1F0 ATPase subunit 2